MGKSAGSNQPMKMVLSVKYFTLWYYSPKAIYTTAWNRNGPEINAHKHLIIGPQKVKNI